MRFFQQCLLIIGLCFLQISSHAQELYFNTLSIRDGLPTNIIADITQDQYGFIWVSTGSGLARYDGNRITVFSKGAGENTLPSNELTSLLENGDEVWVGTWNGLCKINIKTFEITNIPLDNINVIRTLHLGKDKVLWVGTGKGLIRYELETGQYRNYTKENSNLSHNTIRSIYEDSAGTLWVGTFDGLNYLTRGKKHFTRLQLPFEQNQPGLNHLVLTIKPSINDDPNLWIGTDKGLYRVDARDMNVLPIGIEDDLFSNTVIKTIHPDNQGKLWLGTDFGLNIYDPISNENQQYFHHPQLPYSIANNVVWQIQEDKNGVIWLATSNGISKVNKLGDFFAVHDISYSSKGQLIGNQIKSMLVSRTGDHWLATQNGVIRIDSKTGSKTFLNNQGDPAKRIIMNNVSGLLEDQEGRIWIGTAGGMNIWNPDNHETYTVRADSTNGLGSNYIGHFAQEPDGTIWVSAWQGGLYRITGDARYPDNLYFDKVKGFDSGTEKFVYGDGYIWIVEYDKLYRVDPKTLQSTSIDSFNKAIVGKTIYTLFYSNNGTIWAGTLNGIIQFDIETETVFFHEIITVSDDIITSITEDDAGNIWSVSNSSIQRLVPHSKQLNSYPFNDNLPIKSFYYSCVAKRADGHLLFGGDNGFISFSPSQVQIPKSNPPTYITELEINSQKIIVNNRNNNQIFLTEDISFVHQLTLNYNQRSFALEFSTLDFLHPEQNRYSYQLQGHEKIWHNVSGSENTAIYSNIPAGEYTFLVKSINNNTDGNPNIGSLNITILPPFLLRWYFIIFYIALAIAIVYFALKTYSDRVKLKNELKISQLKVEHAEELEKTKENFFTNISHELRTPISLILPPLHQLKNQKMLDEKSILLISLAEKNASRLLKLVNQVLDFNKVANNSIQLHVQELEIVSFSRQIFSLFADQSKRHHIHYQFESNQEEIKLWADPDKLESILFNLLSNAFKFTPDHGKITLHIIKTHSEEHPLGECQFNIADSGVGIEEDAQIHIFDRFYQASAGKRISTGSGIGLTMAAEFVAMHRGAIRVKSILGQGTTFSVNFPIGKRHLPVESVLSFKQKKEDYMMEPKSFESNFSVDLASDKTTILVIDDNDDIISFIKISLEHKYHILTAGNGEEGLAKACRFLPQVIICDIMMPIMNGIVFCKKIKENPKTSPMSIILLTAKSLVSNQLEGIQSGADVYLTKPFEIAVLEAYIDQLLVRREELNRYFNDELMGLSNKYRAIDNEKNSFVKKVMDIIEANIANPSLSVEMISNEMAMSSTHLYRKFKESTEHAPKELIQKYRLKKASLLLQNHEGNISDISHLVGFSSLSYFSRSFKAEFGMSPKQYQDKYK